MVAGVLASLGGEIDRQAEEQGVRPREVAFDNPNKLESETIDLVDLRESVAAVTDQKARKIGEEK